MECSVRFHNRLIKLFNQQIDKVFYTAFCFRRILALFVYYLQKSSKMVSTFAYN